MAPIHKSRLGKAPIVIDSDDSDDIDVDPSDDKSIGEKYEFDYLLLFESNFVPVKFASWIANKVDVRTSEIILKDKIIPITKESVHDPKPAHSRSNSIRANLDSAVEFYGSSANGHGDKISVNNLTMHKSCIPVNIDAFGNANAPSCLDGQHFVTPDVSYLRNRNNFLNEVMCNDNGESNQI
uniref:Uncharacterized protein n=1 Tax=Oryza punctata TaxID=4537 RepID=A0A0E0JRT6_ORYPU